ncbi:MAG: aminodeoxychorismate/anthranilate synthase component II [Candidatus Lambdaproteobacteria bacterium]|nr:aminodeoxychorismate/anthranilate synthase component II [Candidatus Lambdaproteobacteria bacterium]
MRVLFLENEDSFTWNVLDALPLRRGRITLRRGAALRGDPEALAGFDALVVGPGPTDPVRAGLVETVQAAAARHLPVLGICLGCQAIGLAFGARLVRTRPAHGQRCLVTFTASRCFGSVAGPQRVMRYHSLSLAGVAAPLRVVAATGDGIPMAVEHETLPIAGLQFHPDSFGTPRGPDMLADFFRACR